MMSNRVTGVLIVFVLLALLAASSLFVVDQRQQALVFQFGEIKNVILEPGLYVKVPLVQNVRFLDKRILTIDTLEPERFITREKKNVLVDHFVKWRIVNPKLFYESVSGDEGRAEIRLLQTVNSGLREEFGRLDVHDVISGARNKIMEDMQERANNDAQQIGVEVIDVRLKRVELPTEVSGSVYQRMESERKQAASKLRAAGAAEAEKLRAEADQEYATKIANANRDAQKVMGEGDARATAIYAEAYNKDRDFYSFYRSLEAYRDSFKDKSDVMVVDPSSDFFKYLKDPSGIRPN